MKYGVSTFLWAFPFTTEQVGLLKKIAAMGFTWVEIPLDWDVPLDVERVGAAVRDQGLSCSAVAMMNDARDPIHPDPAVRESGIAYLRYCADALAKWGGGPIVGASYTAAGRKYWADEDRKAREFDLAVRQMRQAAEYAADRGVTIAMEPLNRYESSFMSTTVDGLALVEAVGHPALGLNLDTFHLNIEEKRLGEAIERAGQRLLHLHVCENDRGMLGSGHIPWAEVAAAVKKIGYDRALVIESFTIESRALAEAAGVWRPLAPSMDQMAAEGLAFLRRVFT